MVHSAMVSSAPLGLIDSGCLTHSLRCGLHSAAASRLGLLVIRIYAMSPRVFRFSRHRSFQIENQKSAIINVLLNVPE